MYNPTRRNRNIGTTKQGHGQNNKLVIPYPCSISKNFYERLTRYEKTEITINGHLFLFVEEQTRASSAHACSIADTIRIIEQIPSTDYGELRLILFRQPKRKEEVLSPVWGRLIYSYEFEKKYLPAIIIEAQNYGQIFKWEKQLSVDAQHELEQLKADGHPVTFDGRHHTFEFKPENVRNTQLYRTLPHEFGHYVHYLNVVEQSSKADEMQETWEERSNAYFRIPRIEKEKFAHRYAYALSEKLIQNGIIPFSPLS